MITKIILTINTVVAIIVSIIYLLIYSFIYFHFVYIYCIYIFFIYILYIYTIYTYIYICIYIYIYISVTRQDFNKNKVLTTFLSYSCCLDPRLRQYLTLNTFLTNYSLLDFIFYCNFNKFL